MSFRRKTAENLALALGLAMSVAASRSVSAACDPVQPSGPSRPLLDAVAASMAAAKAATPAQSSTTSADSDDAAKFRACIAKLKGLIEAKRPYVDQPPGESDNIAKLNAILKSGEELSSRVDITRGSSSAYETLSKRYEISPADFIGHDQPHAAVEYDISTQKGQNGYDFLFLSVDGYLLSPNGNPIVEIKQSFSVGSSACVPEFDNTIAAHFNYGADGAVTVSVANTSHTGEATKFPDQASNIDDTRTAELEFDGASDGGVTTSLAAEQWPAATLEPRKVFVLDAQYSVSGFKEKDFQAAKLGYTFQTSAAPSFDNMSAYGELHTTNAADGSTQQNVFISEARPKASTIRELAPDESAANLRETAYYDYSNAEVEKLVAAVKARKPATKAALAREIVRVINAKVADDSDAATDGVVLSQSASEVLKSGKAVCQGYSVLFVAVARALGLPARMIIGDFVDQDSAGGHAWVEAALDGKHWTPIEPQNTDDLGLLGRFYIPYSVERLYEAADRDTADNDAAIKNDPLLTGFDIHSIAKAGTP